MAAANLSLIISKNACRLLIAPDDFLEDFIKSEQKLEKSASSVKNDILKNQSIKIITFIRSGEHNNYLMNHKELLIYFLHGHRFYAKPDFMEDFYLELEIRGNQINLIILKNREELIKSEQEQENNILISKILLEVNESDKKEYEKLPSLILSDFGYLIDKFKSNNEDIFISDFGMDNIKEIIKNYNEKNNNNELFKAMLILDIYSDKSVISIRQNNILGDYLPYPIFSKILLEETSHLSYDDACEQLMKTMKSNDNTINFGVNNILMNIANKLKE